MSKDAVNADTSTLWERLMDGAASVFDGVRRSNRKRRDKEKFRSALGNLLEKEVDLNEDRQKILEGVAESESGLNPNDLIKIKRELRKNKEAQEDVKEIYKELFDKDLKLDID